MKAMSRFQCHGLPTLSFAAVLMCAADERTTRQTVPQARVSPRPIRLPIIKGTDIRFTRLPSVNGLSQTNVGHIVQDDQGFMWFGTPYGLGRFDGYDFRLFVHDPGKADSLSGVFISALFKGRDGTLWVGCDQFLNKLDPATETFTRYPVPLVTHISQDSSGMLWLATGTGLYGLDPATGRFRQYTHDPNDPSSLSGNDVKSSGEDKGGRFWVANAEGLDEFERRTGKVTLHIPLHEPSSGLSFYEDRFGVFWIPHVSGNELAVFDRKTNTLTPYSLHEEESPSTSLTGVTAMLEDKDGTLWLGTHGAGLLKFDRDHRRFIRYRNNPAAADSLPQNSVDSLFADREGSIWAGLGRKGLTRFATKPLPFTSFLHNPNSPSGMSSMSDPFVGAIYEDRQGILWVGTPEALNRIDRKAGHYTSYRRTAGPAAGTDAITIREDRSGNLWVGTYGHGLLRFDRRTGQFKTYQHNLSDPYSLSNGFVSRLLVDHIGTLWAATMDTLNRFDATTQRFTTFKLDPPGNLFYQELVEDREGALWLGTDSSGLRRFDPATGQFIVYQHDMNRPGTLSDNRVNSVYFDASGTMWLGTQNGLNKFDRKKGTFTVYTRRDGLPGNAVGCVLEDAHGDLWMSTNNGVARFNPQSGTFKSYSTPDGLSGPDLTGWGACFKSPSGEMFFGGFSGATAFFPDAVDTKYTPPIVLTNFQLSGNPIEIGGHSPLQKSISYTSDLILSHQQNIFSFTFAALSYSNPATNRYRYKLEGLQRDWTEIGSDRRQATYTTLPGGTYTFRVQGATSRGAWSEPGVALRIEILAPWWGALWFRAVSAGGAGGLLWMLYLFRLRRLTARMQRRLGERMAERERIARELHDTLLQGFQGLVLHFQAVLDQIPDQEPAQQTMKKALGKADEVLIEGRRRVRDLRADGSTAKELSQELACYGEELAKDSAIAFNITLVGSPQSLHPVVRDEIYRIAREALANAFRHSQASNIDVEIAYDPSTFCLRVRDNGSGIDQEILGNGLKGHWGLSGMRERAQNISAQLSIWSNRGAGTKIDLRLPAKAAYARSPKRSSWYWMKRGASGVK
ncbi:MAG: Two component sensor histidine kinase [Candidatus Solibacter sp.]|nr:Two component sensor histidine kinase [Candidatus Solibacter sp.]